MTLQDPLKTGTSGGTLYAAWAASTRGSNLRRKGNYKLK